MKNYSLKWRLVSTISCAFILLWVIVFAWLYHDLEQRLQNTLDERLSTSARMVARLIQQLPLEQLTESLHAESENALLHSLIACEVSIFRANVSLPQHVIARTQGAPKNLKNQQVGFSTWTENGLQWRSYVLREGEVQVVVAEKIQLRQNLLKQILQSVLIPLLLTLIICILLILWIIRLEFLPLDHITRHLIQKKQSLDEASRYLIELRSQKIPKEIQPFVDNLLMLIERLHKSLEHEKNFSAFAAHELRTPLTAIKTHVQLSQLMLNQTASAQDTAKVIDNLKHAERSIQRYQQLLEQLLLLSQTEAGIQAAHSHADMRSVLETVLSELTVEYPNLSAKLQIDWASLVAQHINIPAPALHMVLKNLIQNAYLHAEDAPNIQIYMQDLQLIIADQGKSLNEDDFTILTQRFWRKSAHKQGYGLGLTLVKVLLEQYGYLLQFQANQPQGLKVIVSFDAAPSATEKQQTD
ncbi:MULTISPECIES: sensor histidine kinase [Acinetobacter]|uniref:sensor histidine kinase n=1 Tax=Acinetobacter TaxID=469 RepID=UPI0015B5D64F|nr:MULTISPECIES: ATP-binding protein [Acinetobacter]MBT0887938.1 HAMP domain-containing histidine kinase [Acinetobacter towneri]MCO8060277.1 sensor histidine kinase [Acinetobacter towneri]MCO8065927.1 sensor histidine kinase [Acinetobacter towneri]MDV2455630.1 histidine kinase dimerization/phospho-acceptor domain-containing protein [Acinetobacter towneri]NWJ93345.1 sensor histidine kinase N-terminal domain-containing protein [Acinetobacter sp. Swhac1]